MPKVNINELCESFSAAIQKKVNYPQGLRATYPDGFTLSDLFGGRSTGSVYQLKTRSFTAEYIRGESESSRVTGDTTTRWESLTITDGEKSKFSASRLNGGYTQHFGSGERYLGSTTIPGEEWKVSSGKIPVRLIEDYLKPRTRKTAAQKTKGSPAAG